MWSPLHLPSNPDGPTWPGLSEVIGLLVFDPRLPAHRALALVGTNVLWRITTTSSQCFKHLLMERVVLYFGGRPGGSADGPRRISVRCGIVTGPSANDVGQESFFSSTTGQPIPSRSV